MKFYGLVLALFCGFTAGTQAQVTVEVSQEQDQFLQGESMPITVRIMNLSGQTLHLGDDPSWLTFSIASPEGLVVTKKDNAPVLGEFDLESSKVAIKHLDLAPYFSFSHGGRFGIVATVRIKGWGEEVSSRPRFFDIIEGARLWEQTVGVPKASGATNPVPEVRRYTLQQANYLRGQIRLYLRVTDVYGNVIRVCPIGQMVSFGRPEAPQVDRLSNLHVLYQNGPVSFSYTEFDPSGELLVRRTYDYINTRPRLKQDMDGDVLVTGGQRRVTTHDVPPPTEEELNPPAPPAPQTNPPAQSGRQKH